MDDSQTLSFRAVLGAVLALTCISACASAPAFHPSTPVSEAPSLQEALLLCNEYRVPVPAKRPVALKPFLNCMDEVSEGFHVSPWNPFEIFRSEFHNRFGSLNEAQWSPELGANIGLAVHALLREFWRGLPASARAGALRPDVYTPEEKQAVLKHFPFTARAIGAEHWATAPQVQIEPKLERLKAAVAAMSASETFPGEPWTQGDAPAASAPQPGSDVAAPTRSQITSEICASLKRLRGETDYLSSLAQDEHEMTMMNPGTDAVPGVVHARFEMKLDQAVAELNELRPKVASAKTQGLFRASECQ